MRHLDLAEMLIKMKVESKEIKLLKVASADNTSDYRTYVLHFNIPHYRTPVTYVLHYWYALLYYNNVCFKIKLFVYVIRLNVV